MKLAHLSSLEQFCRHVKLDFRLFCPILFGLTRFLLYMLHVYMLNMAQSNRGS